MTPRIDGEHERAQLVATATAVTKDVPAVQELWAREEESSGDPKRWLAANL